MNEIRLPGLLLERYNTRFQGLLHKLIRPAAGTVCSYSNNLANRPVNNSMHRPLKLKIQNALNQVILGDAESRGLFVGGRRRNRKKRRARNVKEKKKAKKCDGKGSPVVVRCNTEQAVVPLDQRPLIESDFESTLSLAVTEDLQYVDDLPPLIDTEDQENLDSEEMPFAFFKRKNKENSDKNVILEEKVKTIDGSPAAKQDMATAEQEVNDEQDAENNKTPDEHLNNKGHHDTENNKTPEEHLNNKGHHDTENKKTPEEHLNNKGHHDTENNKTPEEHLNNKGHHDTENNKTPEVHLNNKGHHDTENNKTPEVHLNNKGHHDKEGAEDVQEPADEVVPAVLEVNPEKENKREKITQEAEDSQDGTTSEKTALDEQVGKEVSDQQPKTSNGMKIEESSPLIKKQEPDMEIACCVIL